MRWADLVFWTEVPHSSCGAIGWFVPFNGVRTVVDAMPETRGSFSAFAESAEPRLRHALVATLGQTVGLDATADALAYGWEHWERLAEMDNPVGYLYRVGRSSVRTRRVRPKFVPVPPNVMPEVEPGLPVAFATLSDRQRVAVLMVHAYGWSRREAADTLEVSVSTLDSHLQRGLEKLRDALGVTPDA